MSALPTNEPLEIGAAVNVADQDRTALEWFPTALEMADEQPLKPLDYLDAICAIMEALPRLKIKYWPCLFQTLNEPIIAKMCNEFFVLARNLYIDTRQGLNAPEAKNDSFYQNSLDQLRNLFLGGPTSALMKLLVFKLYCARVKTFDEQKFLSRFGDEFGKVVSTLLDKHPQLDGKRLEIPARLQAMYQGKSAPKKEIFTNATAKSEQKMSLAYWNAQEKINDDKIEELTKYIAAQQAALTKLEAEHANLMEERKLAQRYIVLSRERESAIRMIERTFNQNPNVYKYLVGFLQTCINPDMTGKRLGLAVGKLQSALTMMARKKAELDAKAEDMENGNKSFEVPKSNDAYNMEEDGGAAKPSTSALEPASDIN